MEGWGENEKKKRRWRWSSLKNPDPEPPRKMHTAHMCVYLINLVWHNTRNVAEPKFQFSLWEVVHPLLLNNGVIADSIQVWFMKPLCNFLWTKRSPTCLLVYVNYPLIDGISSIIASLVVYSSTNSFFRWPYFIEISCNPPVVVHSLNFDNL